jgi:murein DD-endopeptidase MepM/ murein hydrolase activator NlpD
VRSIAIGIAMACVLVPQAATACDAIGGYAGVSPLHTRKPVVGDDVYLVSGFGMRNNPILGTRKLHAGVDWAAPVGTPVLAAAGGRVLSAGVEEMLGTTVRIDHGAGWQTVYAHLTASDVREGECVAPLSVIGKVGATGPAAGPRLHFEVHENGRAIDPLGLAVKTSPPASQGK